MKIVEELTGPVVEISDEEIERITRESEARAAKEPAITSIGYAAGRMEMTLRNGVTVSFDPRTWRGLENATDAELATVRAIGRGTAIEVTALDQHYEVIPSLEVLFQIRTVQGHLSAIASSKSEKKAVAARENGALGGRPRKQRATITA